MSGVLRMVAAGACLAACPALGAAPPSDPAELLGEVGLEPGATWTDVWAAEETGEQVAVGEGPDGETIVVLVEPVPRPGDADGDGEIMPGDLVDCVRRFAGGTAGVLDLAIVLDELVRNLMSWPGRERPAARVERLEVIPD